MSLSIVLARAGLVPEEMLSELRRWKVPGVPEEVGPSITSAEELVGRIEREFESKDYVEVRITDPDLIHQFINTQARGSLNIDIGNDSGSFPVIFGRTPSGGYVFPWVNQMVEDAFENGDAWLVENEHHVHFSKVDVYYYGEQKAFIVCQATPRQ